MKKLIISLMLASGITAGYSLHAEPQEEIGVDVSRKAIQDAIVSSLKSGIIDTAILGKNLVVDGVEFVVAPSLAALVLQGTVLTKTVGDVAGYIRKHPFITLMMIASLYQATGGNLGGYAQSGSNQIRDGLKWAIKPINDFLLKPVGNSVHSAVNAVLKYFKLVDTTTYKWLSDGCYINDTQLSAANCADWIKNLARDKTV